MNYKNIKIDEFDYHLPSERIAKFPLKQRDASKLLIYKNGNISQTKFFDIDKYLPENSLLILNNTKVFFARLIFKKQTGGKIEIFCLNPYQPADYENAFASKGKVQWEVLIGNLKKWKNDTLSLKYIYKSEQRILQVRYIGKHHQNHIVEFIYDNDITFAEILEIVGQIPIPPYLKRKPTENDKNTYQTVYSKIKGSVAAPTAGLHFTENVFNKLKNRNISVAELTLHVGAGTFKPVKSEFIAEHLMHTEIFSISIDTLKKIKNNLGRITAVGTTSLRTLETLYYIGYKIIKNQPDFNFVSQWEIYQEQITISPLEALQAIENFMLKQKLNHFDGKTQIMIVPGYKFKITDILITNFHQPKSTLLLLVAAFIGDDWKKVYDYALKNDFRFLSYGDSSILFRRV